MLLRLLLRLRVLRVLRVLLRVLRVLLRVLRVLLWLRIHFRARGSWTLGGLLGLSFVGAAYFHRT